VHAWGTAGHAISQGVETVVEVELIVPWTSSFICPQLPHDHLIHLSRDSVAVFSRQCEWHVTFALAA